MGMLTLPQGRLFGAAYESLLFGINFVLFLSMLYLFGKQKTITLPQRIRIGVICVIFVMCVVHLASVLRGLQIAFFEVSDPNLFYNDHSQPIDLTQKTVYAVATVLGDSLLIHRMYIIFDQDWRAIIVPFTSNLATLGLWCALMNVYRLSVPGQTLYVPAILRLAPAAYAASLFTNIVITSSIIVRIMLAIRRIRGASASTTFYRRMLAYTVESGLIYPTVLLATGILFLKENNGLEILSGSNTQVICIVPILLTLQMRLDLSIYDAAVRQRATMGSAASTLRVASRPVTSQSSGPRSDTFHFDVELSPSHASHHIGSVDKKHLPGDWERPHEARTTLPLESGSTDDRDDSRAWIDDARAALKYDQRHDFET